MKSTFVRVLHPGDEDDEIRSIAVMLCDHNAMDGTICLATSKAVEGEGNTDGEALAVTIDVEDQSNTSSREARQNFNEPPRQHGADNAEALSSGYATSDNQAVEEGSTTGLPDKALTRIRR